MDLSTITDLLPADQTHWQPGDAFLAGGSWLFSEPQPELRRLLDLQAFQWPALTTTNAGLEIAATCTLAELSRWPGPGNTELIRQCCQSLLGSFKVWNTATVGGNICLSLPAAPMTSLAAALDGVAVIWGPDSAVREQPVAEFVTGDTANTLAAGELLRSVLLPERALKARTAFRQESLSPLGRSAALLIGRSDADGGAVFTITAATIHPYQLRYSRLPGEAELLADLAALNPGYHDDVHGAPAWRAQLTRRLLAELRAELAG